MTTTAEPHKLDSIGGPLFRRPDTSHEEFSTAWHRHAQVVASWFLKKFGVVEYTQIHMPRADHQDIMSDKDKDSPARRILRQADGVALVRRYQTPMAGGPGRYFEEVILTDERRFLHDESGAGAVKGNPPAYDVPELAVDEWRELALQMGGIEHVKIRDGQDVVGGAWWGKWEEIEK
ncbi:Uu.00g077010.m01.CDS01 [Anthostomella pinea]|uniref:Uu.00g077010.m01.CDS01 n=1 Tax=Anthostomella pinea TaxID=933095 RepID=A0AAI8VVZ7_9PEZI|nr:Uu.00g077010.m01.CDS01 [Anthostomella pinea]